MELTYKELQEKLKELEPEIGQVQLNVSKKKLEEIYQNYLNSQIAVEPEPVTPCPVCGSPLALADNWWSCTACPHKHYADR